MAGAQKSHFTFQVADFQEENKFLYYSVGVFIDSFLHTHTHAHIIRRKVFDDFLQSTQLIRVLLIDIFVLEARYIIRNALDLERWVVYFVDRS